MSSATIARLGTTSSNDGARGCEILGATAAAIEGGAVRFARRREHARWRRAELDSTAARGAERRSA